MNLYAYCANNPVNWVDPWGLLVNDPNTPNNDPNAVIIIHAERGRPWGQTNQYVTWLLDDYGHAWVEIRKSDGTTMTRGSYKGGVDDDSKKNYRTKHRKLGIERAYPVTEEQADAAIDYINNYDGSYKGGYENCVDFVYHVADAAGIDLPGSDWGIDTPDQLADDLLELEEKETTRSEE